MNKNLIGLYKQWDYPVLRNASFRDNFRLHSLYYLPKNVRRRYFRDLSSGDINYKTLISRFLEKS